MIPPEGDRVSNLRLNPRGAASEVRRESEEKRREQHHRQQALERAAVRCPSLRRYPVGMASPKCRTALRSGDISAWDFDRQLAVAASLGLRARIVLEPA